MAKPQLALDAQYWDMNLATPRNLDGRARSVPGEPFPLDAARASRAHRVNQLAILRQGFPLGLIPSLSPVSSHKDLGSFALQCFPLRISAGDWWLGLVGQFRPKKLISNIRSQLSSAANAWDLETVQNFAKQVFDKSIYSSGLFTEIPVTDLSSLVLSSEGHGERKKSTNKLVYYRELPEHEVSLEAAWPELFIDSKGRYWNVPESISLDLASLDFGSGFKYRFGIHKNGGKPKAMDGTDVDSPPSLMPGLCAKAAFSCVKSKDFWREKETRDDIVKKKAKGTNRLRAYDERMKEPHATASAIVGGTCGAWLRGNKNPTTGTRIRSPVFADLFGSLCYTFQHGKFTQNYKDLTRVDARLDLSSATAFANGMLNVLRRRSNRGNPASSPQLSVILQQQVAGPIVFRIDTKCSLHTPCNGLVKIEDFMYSLNYSLRALGSGKVVAWYSPKRKEGMIELRFYEF